MFGKRKQRATFHNQVPFAHLPSMNPYLMRMYPEHHLRQYPYPMYGNELGNWNPYIQGNQAFGGSHLSNHPYQPSPMPMYNQYPTPNYHFQQQQIQQQHQNAPNNYAQNVFQNPLEPEHDQFSMNSQQSFSPNPYMNPYPKQSFIPKQPSGVQSIINSFKSQDGSLDFNKMMNTAGSMMSAVNQVSSMVKGLGGMIKL